MSKDAIELAVGQFGWWQAKCCFLMALLRMPTAWFQLAIIFIAPETTFHCEDNNFNYTVSNLALNETCWRGKFCKDMIFDRTTFSETIITQWELVCDRKHLVTLTQTSFMFGVLIGNVIFGILSDMYGRKAPLMAALLMQAAAGIASSYVTSFWLFLALRFLLALSTGGSMITSFVFCMEILSGKWRTIVSILYQVPFGLGQALMALISYYYRDWRDFNIILSLFSSLFLFYWWFIPESPRWLLAVGRHQEAARILRRAAVTNNRSEEQIKAFLSFNSQNAFHVNSKSGYKTAKASDLFTSPALRCTSLCVFISWFIAGLCFFGLNQYQGKLGGDLFLNVAISGLLGGIPGPIASVFVTQKFGRRYTIFLSLMIAGIACLSIAAIPIGVYPQDWLRRTLSTISLVGMSVSYPALYLFSGELFPTVVRNVGVGTAAMCARIGSMLASFLLLTSSLGSWVPVLLLGVFTLVSAFFILPLPETKDKPLPDTIEELESNQRDPKSAASLEGYTAVPNSEKT